MSNQESENANAGPNEGRDPRHADPSWGSVRDALAEALAHLGHVARRRNDARSMKEIDAIHESLKKLNERILHHRLPLVVIRTALGDARLEALIVHSRLKMDLMYDHQELLAPNEELRAQSQEYRRGAHDKGDRRLAAGAMTREQAMDAVMRDLGLLTRAEQMLREEAARVWNVKGNASSSP